MKPEISTDESRLAEGVVVINIHVPLTMALIEELTWMIVRYRQRFKTIQIQLIWLDIYTDTQ